VWLCAGVAAAPGAVGRGDRDVEVEGAAEQRCPRRWGLMGLKDFESMYYWLVVSNIFYFPEYMG